MHRIDSSGTLASLPAPASPGATAGYFTGGNPGLGQAATIVSADWLNAVQEELLAVMTAAGVAPSKTTRNQLLTSLEKLFRQKLTSNLTLYVAQSQRERCARRADLRDALRDQAGGVERPRPL